MAMRSACSVLVAGFILAGCGGGSGPSVEVNESERIVGDLITRGSYDAQPTIQSNGTVTVAALDGIFTNVRLRYPKPDLSDSTIAYIPDAQTIHLMDGDGSRDKEFGSAERNGLDFAPDGKTLYYTEDLTVRAMNLVTGAVTTLPLTDFALVSVSPDGTKLALARPGPTSKLFIANIDGSSPTEVAQGGISCIDWIDPERVVYNDDGALRRVRFDGTGDVLMSGGLFEHGRFSVSPDGRLFASARRAVSTSQWTIATQLVFSSFVFEDDAKVVNYSKSAQDVAWTPDGGVLIRDGDNDLRVQWSTDRIELIKPSLVPPLNFSGLACMPHIPERVLVGASAPYGSGCAAVIMAQAGDHVTSIVTADATTRSTLGVIAESVGPNPASFVFRIEADRITKLLYNVDNTMRTTSGLSVGSINGALVSVSATTGFVTAVLPYIETRSGRPTVTMGGSDIVFRGEFAGVFDQSGREVAALGAREVRLGPDGTPTVH